jgi:hypothetical protein
MSLQQLAQTIQSRGRGGDSVLIHMTPKEVQGLQSLAVAHGGSLTTNPDTGLPEANFLKSILPTLLGVGLAATGVGAPLAALMVGGGATLLSGSLKEGLLAGLGAFGGAGLGAGLTGAGAGAAQAAAQTGVPAAAQGAVGQGLQAAIPSATAPSYSLANSMFGGGTGLQMGAAPGLQAGIGAGPNMVQALPQMATAPVAPGAANLAAADATNAFTAQPWYDKLGQGASAAFKNPAAALEAMGGGKKAIQYGMAAAAPVMAGMAPTSSTPEEDNERYMYQFDRPRRDPNEGYTGPYSGERQYFGDSSLTRIGMAEGGSPEDKFQMTGESKAAYDYLMGRAPVSPGAMRAQETQAAPMAQAAMPAAPAPALSGGLGGLMDKSSSSSVAPMYNFDPRTGQLMLIHRPEDEPEPTMRDRYAYEGSGYARGGIAGLAKGGFVVPADVVSMLGEGSTDAGLRALQAKYGSAVKPIRGPGTGQSDSISTSIEGKQPARVADGEAYIPPAVIAKHGGAKKFYAMLDRVRTASQGHTKQQRRVNPSQVMA